MSYLVDALKKAERERHQRKGADMHALSAGEESFERSGNGRLMVWVVTVLIVVNVAFLVYLLFPRGDDATVIANSEGTPTPHAAPAAAPETVNPPASQPPAVARRQPQRARAQPAQPQAPAPAPVPQPKQQRQQPQSQRALTGLRLSEDPRGRWSNPRPQSRGSVTYSSQPLDDHSGDNSGDTQYQAPTPSRQPPPAQNLGNSVPQVTINGQLYSTVPGRSFILINGRRYHEGERLAAGPAVESIDRRGATLNYRGRRYHVDGPG